LKIDADATIWCAVQHRTQCDGAGIRLWKSDAFSGVDARNRFTGRTGLLSPATLVLRALVKSRDEQTAKAGDLSGRYINDEVKSGLMLSPDIRGSNDILLLSLMSLCRIAAPLVHF